MAKRFWAAALVATTLLGGMTGCQNEPTEKEKKAADAVPELDVETPDETEGDTKKP